MSQEDKPASIYKRIDVLEVHINKLECREKVHLFQ